MNKAKEEYFDILELKGFPFAVSLKDGKFQRVYTTVESLERENFDKQIKIIAAPETKFEDFKSHSKEEREMKSKIKGSDSLNIELNLLKLFSLKLNVDFKGGYETKTKSFSDITYHNLCSYQTQFNASIMHEKDIKINEEVEQEIDRICFQGNKKYFDRLEELGDYLDKVGYFVPRTVAYGSRLDLNYTSLSEEMSFLIAKEFEGSLSVGSGNEKKGFMDMIMSAVKKFPGLDNGNTGFKAKFSYETSDSISKSLDMSGDSISTIGCKSPVVHSAEDYFNNLDENYYDAIFYDDLVPIINLLNPELKQRVYEFLDRSTPIEKTVTIRDDKGTFKGYIDKNGEMSGLGEYTWDNGDKYVGDFSCGFMNGRGTFTFSDGKIYEGQVKKNKLEGFGRITYNKDSKYDYYIGEVGDGQKNGKGIMYYKNDRKYLGEYLYDKYHSFGIFYYDQGSKYIGYCENDVCEGLGTMFYYYGEIYDGNWHNDKKSGEATYYYNDGSFARGTYVNGEREGIFTFYDANGNETEKKQY